MFCRICVVQSQPKKYVLDHANYTALTRQHALDHTGQESICALKDLQKEHEAGYK